MKQTIIQKQLENLFPNSDLEFQVVYQAPYLKVAINYDSTLSFDRATLIHSIQKTLSESNLPDNVEYLALYTRQINQTEPDWSDCIRLIPEHSQEGNRDELSVSQNNDKSEQEVVVTAEEKDSYSSPLENEQISDYCFIRNKSLLNEEIISPPLPVAELVTSFHELSASEKQELLPIMSQLLEKETPDSIEKVSAQQWVEKLFALNPEHLRKARIWLSRYCYDPEKTITTLETIINQSEETVGQNTIESETVPKPRISERVKNEAKKPKNIKIHENEDGLTIIRKWQDAPNYLGVIGTTVYFLVVFHYQPSPLFIFLLLGLLIIYWTIAHWFNRTYITANKKGFIIYHKPIPWLGNGKKIRIEDLEQLYLTKHVTDSLISDIGYEVCANTYSGADKNLLVVDNSKEAFFIAKTLENYFNIGEIGGPEVIVQYHRGGGGNAGDSGGDGGGCGGD